MKIVCGSCGAKYSIADEKVQGKVFKIRCKKCSNVIVVKGDSQETESQQQEAAQESMSGAYGGTSGVAEWYVVIDGDQVGPISPEEIEAYYTSGQIGAESFAWRDGLGDWIALSELDEFAHLTQHDTGGGDATAVVESPFNEGDGAQQEEGGFNEDATSVMPADDFRAQFEEKDQAAANADAGFGDSQAGYDDGGYDSQQYADSNAGSGAYAADGGQSSYDGFGGEQAAFGDGGYDDAGGYDAGGSYDDGGYDAGGSYDDGSYDAGGSYDDGGYDGYGDDAAENDGMFASFDSGADGGDSGYDGFGGYDDADEQEPASDAGMQSANDMIGQRSENSVLFSLSSLDQVGAVSGDDSGASQGGAGGGAGQGAGGGAVTEGSGLIDIQALASAHKVMKGGGGAGGGGGGPVGGPAGDAADDPFGAGTMSMPALMPMGSHKSNKGLIIGLSIGGVVLLGALGAVGYMFMNREEAKPEQKVVYVEKEGDEGKAAEGEKGGGSDDGDKAEQEAAAAANAANAIDKEESKDGEKAEGDETETAEKDDDKKEESSKKDDDSGSRKSASRSSSSSKSSGSGSSSRSGSSRSSSKSDDDDLLGLIDKAGEKRNSGGSSSSGGSSAPKKNVPENLTKSMVKSTIRKWDGRITNCYRTQNRNKMGGTVFVKYTVKPSGRVSSANVTTGKFKGTDVGKCVEGVVRTMKFPESQNSMTITYPFKLN